MQWFYVHIKILYEGLLFPPFICFCLLCYRTTFSVLFPICFLLVPELAILFSDVFFSETLVSLCFLLNCPSFYLLWCWPLKQVFHYSSMFREFKRVVTKASTVMLLPFKRMCLMLTQLFFPLEGPSFHWIQISSRTRAISEGRQYLTTQESDSLPSVVTMY